MGDHGRCELLGSLRGPAPLGVQGSWGVPTPCKGYVVSSFPCRGSWKVFLFREEEVLMRLHRGDEAARAVGSKRVGYFLRPAEGLAWPGVARYDMI